MNASIGTMRLNLPAPLEIAFAEAEAAADFADASPYPTPEDIQKDVYWESDNPDQRTSQGRLFFN